MKNYISIFVLSFILVSSNISYAQYGNSMPQNLINSPSVFNFNTANSITGNQTRYEYDSDADGRADRILTYTYDANGDRTRFEYDSDGDGTADAIYSYTYDANGNLTREESDSDGDGAADEILTYIYDANGNKTREEKDENGDGVPDYIANYTYDANSNKTRDEYDSNGDGVPDYIYAYTYDTNGNITRQEYDYFADGTVDKIHTYTYDTNGNITKEERDSDADGTADEILTYTYDANGNLTREERDFDGDGTLDLIFSYTYDANGNRIKAEVDNDGDGIFEYEYRFGYYNTLFCKDLGDGLVHKLEVIIPESGVWRFALCGSSFQNVLALSSSDYCDSTLFYATDGCSNGDASVDIRLEEAGTYYLTVGGKGETDKGNYNLEITRLQGLDAPSIEKEMITVYPNPAKNQITVNSSMKIDSYQIFNTLGKKVLGGVLTNSTIQIESLHSGSYFIVLDDKNSNQTYLKKFIK